MTLFLLSDSLWYTQSIDYAMNSGVFLSEGEVVLVDPGVRLAEIDAIARFVAGRGAAAKWLVLTHGHWDHVLGPERFPGVRTVAQARYRDVVAREADLIRFAIAKWEASFGHRRSELFTPPEADVTFEGEMALQAGKLELRLLHMPGHAPDQLAIYEPARACLWAADILSDLEIPYVEHSLAEYERTLERLAGYDLGLLVPGHGTPTADRTEIRARQEADRAYLAELRERVASAVQRGRAVHEAVAACADMHYRHAEANRPAHQLNVESVCLELGGQADPRRVGWRQDWFGVKEEEKRREEAV